MTRLQVTEIGVEFLEPSREDQVTVLCEKHIDINFNHCFLHAVLTSGCHGFAT